MATDEPEAVDLLTLSRDAADSTYAPDPDVDPDRRPPSGPQVIQTLGRPGASVQAGKTTTKSSTSSSS